MMILQIVKELEAKNHFFVRGGGGGGGGAETDKSNGVNFEHHRKLLLL